MRSSYRMEDEKLTMDYVKNMSVSAGNAPLVLYPGQEDIQRLCEKHNVSFVISQGIPLGPISDIELEQIIEDEE
jgi:hypothetical protein